MASRRTVTVLFTDLVDSTRLMSSLGPDRAEQLRHDHFGYMRNALAVHRGTEVKTVGDSFMAVFESAADAIACAVTMQRSAARHSRESGHVVALRVGIDIGDATVSEGDYFGTAVITASRLCGAAEASEILATDVAVGIAEVPESGVSTVGLLELKGLPRPTAASAIHWDRDEADGLRVALVDDSALLRSTIAQSLVAAGIEVVLEAGEPSELERQLDVVNPHVVVMDVRMPPTYTTEGLDAARRLKQARPELGVLVLSAEVHVAAARALLATTTSGIGYLLKDRVADLDELSDAIRSVARGGSAIDPNVVGSLGSA